MNECTDASNVTPDISALVTAIADVHRTFLEEKVREAEAAP